MSYTTEERIKRIEESSSYEELIGKGILPNVHNENYYFVSYSHKDYKFVLKDIIELEEQGLNIWYDSGMRAGENWIEIAKQFISKFQCKGVIFYLSENSLVSNACTTEMDYITNTDKKFFSINLPLSDGTITDGYTMATKLKADGKPIADDTINITEKFFSNEHLYLRCNASIEEKKYALEKNLVGEDLFEFRFSPLLGTTELTICKDPSRVTITIPSYIEREKIVNPKDLETYEKANHLEARPLLPINHISNVAFTNFTHLETISLPKTISYIGESAFRNCFSLKSINLKDLNELEIIYDKTFLNCKSLRSITLPSRIKTISSQAFAGCRQLKVIKNTSSLTHIGEKAFFNCHNLTTIDLPPTLKSIDDWAFSDCYKLKKIALPNSLTQLGEYVFDNCTALKTVYLPENTKEDEDGFISINGKVALGCIFTNCNKLENYFVDENCPTYTSIEGNVYSKDESSFVLCAPAKTSVNLLKVKNVDEYAFANCKKLKSVTILQTLEFVAGNSFLGCDNLAEVVLSDNSLDQIHSLFYADVKPKKYSIYGNSNKIKSIDGNLISSDSKEFLKYASGKKQKGYNVPLGIEKIKQDAFVGCNYLTKIIIPNTVKIIEKNSFACCEKLKSISLPNKISVIQAYAFEGCTALKELIIPKSVKNIGTGVFYGCDNLETIINHSNLVLDKEYLGISENVKIINVDG